MILRSRQRVVGALVLAALVTGSGRAQMHQGDWADTLGDHEGPVFEAQVVELLGPEDRRQQVRLRVIRVHQGQAPRSLRATVILGPGGRSYSGEQLAAMRRSIGLEGRPPGEPVVFVGTPTDAGWVLQSLGPPDSRTIPGVFEEHDWTVRSFVRGSLDPARMHPEPVAPVAGDDDPPEGGGSFGQ